MAEYTYINGDFDKLVNVLANSGLFTSVSNESFNVPGDTSAYTGAVCTVDEKSGFFKFGKRTVSGYSNVYIGLCINEGENPNFSWKATDTDVGRVAFFPVSVYVMENGISIICSNGRILITRNQNGKVVVVTGAVANGLSSDTNYHMSKIAAIATTDNTPFAATSTNVNVGGQTLIIPICTLSSTLSYTDKAGWLVYKQNASIGHILFGNKRYFTDGYFVIEDPQI